MKSSIWKALLGSLLAAAAGVAGAQTLADLRNDATITTAVSTYGMGWSQQRYSPLKQVSTSTVKRLVPVWNVSLDNSANASSQPLVIGDTMYVASHTHTLAIDVATGRQKWKAAIEVPADVAGYLCCGIHSRGMAALDGVLYRTTIDAHVMAISMADGKTLWNKVAADYKQGYSMTHAPLIAGGVLITGISGGEYGTRGFINGWDLKTGEKKWTRWTTAAPTEKGGDTWKPGMFEKGGGPTWLTGTYDPELDLVYWGTGNGGPWNAAARGGDSLYICSVLAIRPSTGEIVWFYQFSPGDPYDYDGVNELVLGELPINGVNTKTLMQANRNGFFYVLDRTNGKFLFAVPTVEGINWTTGLDPKTGRPTVNEAMRPLTDGKTVIPIVPGLEGGTNWFPMSFNPEMGVAFIPTNQWAMGLTGYKPEDIKYEPGKVYMGMDYKMYRTGEKTGRVRAFDVAKRKWLWEISSPLPVFAGVLTTRSGLVFSGDQLGFFFAADARSGKLLWQFQTGSAINASPITYEIAGKQYVAILSGLGGDPSFYFKGPKGGMLWVFALTNLTVEQSGLGTWKVEDIPDALNPLPAAK